MKRVKVIGPGVKLANKWCFINDEAIIDDEEFEKNKPYVEVIEEIGEAPITQDTEDNSKTENESQNEEIQSPEGEDEEAEEETENPEAEEESPEGEDEEAEEESPEGEDEELEALKERAKELGIRNTHNMKKETLIAKIEEIQNSGEGENQNPEGE